MPSFPFMPQGNYARPGNIDIAGSIGGLGDALQQGLEYGSKRKIERATREAFAEGMPIGPDGTPDYMAMAAKMFEVGDIDTGMGLTRLAETQTQNAWLRGRPQYFNTGEALVGVTPGQDPEVIYEEPASSKPRQRRRGLNAAGQEVDQEWTDEGWQDVSGPKVTPPRSRALPGAAANDLGEAGSTARDIIRLADTFSDEYAGHTYTGGATNVAGDILPGSNYADQAAWWRDYQERRNAIRHSKFGASLTPTERGEFEKADINPRMQPAQIKRLLDRQRTILDAAAKRRARTWILQGYDADAVTNEVGYTLEELGIKPPAEEGTAVPGSTENAASADAETGLEPEPAPDAPAPQEARTPQDGEEQILGGVAYVYLVDGPDGPGWYTKE